ncbi:ABC transporter ATP-binding protein (plasmid) [Paraclostridium ghonii]|uniref:ABC transporter ATP-binding protein n=1 Tax=Paraclostridium ghonii TaxID=29358 RepID=UPI00202CF602|nr:ABC transporter ATP-binding protein [Paeniclostridium ghonii]MCM0165528.1 ABC transporter ATP-binding protein/permease [Paeniclostridium ghonii]
MNYININLSLIRIVLLSILSSIISVLFPLSLMRISDSITQGDTKTFYINILIGVLIVILQMLFFYIVQRCQNKYIKNNIIIIRYNVVKNLLDMTYDEFKNRKKSEYISMLLNDVQTLETDFYMSFLNFISKGFMLIFSLVGLYMINPIFVLIVVFIAVLMGLIPIFFSKKILRYREEYMLLNSNFTEITNECLDGFKTIKSYNMIKKILIIYNDKVKKFQKISQKLKNSIALANVVFGATTMIISLSIFTIGGYLAINNKVTIGGLIAAVQLLMYVIEPTSSMSESYNSINSTKPIRERINEVCNNKNQVKDIKKQNDIININNIVLENLSYKYNNSDEYILKNINFTFKAGKKYAIIGENGSGKSTLLKIIGNLINDYEGKVMINNIDYKELNQENIFDIISFVHQDDFLFNSSIKDNILLFNNDLAKDEEIKLWVQLLPLSDKLKSYISDVNYTIGYNGEHLSGGEKQKISLMRALLNSKEVLLLDEVTSSLDKYSSDQVIEIVSELEDILSIVITHKMDESLKYFDEIIIVEKGKIINCLSYEDLELAKLR